jgi:hypothetical protein
MMPAPGAANSKTYLAEFARLARSDWPANRTLNVVCHGHSVPAGYFQTPEVRTMEAYPVLLDRALAAEFGVGLVDVSRCSANVCARTRRSWS